MGLDRPAQRGWCGDQAHLPHAGEAHVEGAGDRRGRKGQHVYVFSQRLDLFFLVDAKALLLIHHQQTQLLEAGAFGEQLVGAHHHIDRACAQSFQDCFAFGGGAKAV